jgi:hypothetical protein
MLSGGTALASACLVAAASLASFSAQPSPAAHGQAGLYCRCDCDCRASEAQARAVPAWLIAPLLLLAFLAGLGAARVLEAAPCSLRRASSVPKSLTLQRAATAYER